MKTKSQSRAVSTYLALSILVILLFAGATPGVSQVSLTTSQFVSTYKANLAGDGKNELVRLTDPTIRGHFEVLFEALLDDDLTIAANEIAALELLDVHYELIELSDAPGELRVLGFRESVAPGHADFRGWGPVLVRPLGARDAVYQAPHPIDDQYTEWITIDAYLADCCAAVAQFSGSRRNSNGDDDGDGEPDSDVANDTENLFHVITERMANLTAANPVPAFYFQVHGAANRTSEPTITGSDGADRPPDPPVTSVHPLVPVDDAVDAEGYVTMGVCGFSEGLGDDEDGDYRLCATGNVQGDFLESIGQREQFMHLELERAARVDFNNGTGPGFDGINGLFRALRATLGPEVRFASLSTPATACPGEDIASRVALSVTNAGEVSIDSYYHIAWYLSSDPTWDAGDVLLVGGRDQVHSMAPGQTVTVGIGVNEIPAGAALGSQYLLTVLDETDLVAERLENNNLAASPIEITATCGAGPQAAVYDPAFGAPVCATAGSSCSSGTLLDGRYLDEPNQPNTLGSSCADGTLGTYHFDESLDAIRVSTVDGSEMARYKVLQIEVDVWAYFTPDLDSLDLFYATDATNPTWVYLTTLQPTVEGAQTLSATFVAGVGSLQAVRGTFVYSGGAPSACTTGVYDDHDDLVFAVGNGQFLKEAMASEQDGQVPGLPRIPSM